MITQIEAHVTNPNCACEKFNSGVSLGIDLLSDSTLNKIFTKDEI